MTCHCQATTPTPEQLDLIDHLASVVRSGRAMDAAYAADRAATSRALRELAAAIPGWGLPRLAVAEHLAARGVRCGENLLRKWATRSTATPAPPVWWEVIDHQDPSALQAILERTLGMAVDVDDAPMVRVPVTPEQVAALREALPDAVMGPEGEVPGQTPQEG